MPEPGHEKSVHNDRREHPSMTVLGVTSEARARNLGKPRRGVDTTTGEAGYCDVCQVSMPQGPDACLGYLPNVSQACCGHGVVEPYVVIGGTPDEADPKAPGKWTLRGEDATAFFLETHHRTFLRANR